MGRLYSSFFKQLFRGFLDLHIKEAADAQNISYTPEMLDKDHNTYTSKGGYTSVSMEVIYQLLAIKNINMLRLALRALYVYESDVNVKKDSEALLSYTEVKHILPKYIGYKAAIKEMASKLSEIFRIDVLEKDDCVKTLLEEKQPRKSIIEKIKDGFILSFNLTGAHDSKTKEIEKSVESMHLLSLRISLNLLAIILLKRRYSFHCA